MHWIVAKQGDRVKWTDFVVFFDLLTIYDYATQADLELGDPSASASWVLGLQVCAPTATLTDCMMPKEESSVWTESLLFQEGSDGACL